MVFGYMVVRALLPLVKIFGRLPPAVGRGFARLLNAGTPPFDVVNYWGSRAAARLFNRRRMAPQPAPHGRQTGTGRGVARPEPRPRD